MNKKKGIAKNNVKEEEILQLLDYPSYFDLLKLPLPENREGIISKLVEDALGNDEFHSKS